ncbi:MAG TPA: DUF4097 family beta strand repeat-containing protein [Cyclobacteriaceae bacterium]|nr:DUF4097 family beta strand repeat-containing protein [Cyclobacteriaceae bacterium]
MKTMNNIMMLAVMIFTTTISNGQDFKIPVQNVPDGKLTLVDFMGDLPVEGYAGTEIIITNVDEEALMSPEEVERAKGLTPIYSAGTDNTGIGVHMEKNGNQVTLTCLYSIAKRVEFKVKVPDNFSLKIESGCERTTEIDIKNIKNEIDIKNCMSIKLRNVTGPLVLATISGDIDVVFSTVNRENPVSISNISGAIDITLPANTPADVKLNTVTGNIFTDFDIPTRTDKSMKQVGGSNIEFPLNGGGIDFSIVNISGNIYLRKAS